MTSDSKDNPEIDMTSPKWFEAKPEAPNTPIPAEPVVEEVTKLEVEDSVIAAVEEAKEIDDPGGLMAINPELLEHAKKFHEDHDLPPKKKRVYPVHMLRQLRNNDRYFNKTCSVCYTRVPLVNIEDGKGEVCDSCREN